MSLPFRRLRALSAHEPARACTGRDCSPGGDRFRARSAAVRYGRGILGDPQLRRADLAVLERRARHRTQGEASSAFQAGDTGTGA
jgi:hypothetical protein